MVALPEVVTVVTLGFVAPPKLVYSSVNIALSRPMKVSGLSFSFWSRVCWAMVSSPWKKGEHRGSPTLPPLWDGDDDHLMQRNVQT